MPRQLRNAKPVIYVFCEGESEQAYAEFLKKTFQDVAVIKWHKDPLPTSLFKDTDALYKKNDKYKNSAEVTDEIWFFFDVEISDQSKTDARYKIINRLRRLRKKPNIRVRLLMTTACIEYWLMLHYQMMTPPIITSADKDRMKHKVQGKVPEYEKGDVASTAEIAANYPTAVKNGRNTLKRLSTLGLPTSDDTDERNKWLLKSSMTFTTVHEAILYLESLRA